MCVFTIFTILRCKFTNIYEFLKTRGTLAKRYRLALPLKNFGRLSSRGCTCGSQVPAPVRGGHRTQNCGAGAGSSPAAPAARPAPSLETNSREALVRFPGHGTPVVLARPPLVMRSISGLLPHTRQGGRAGTEGPACPSPASPPVYTLRGPPCLCLCHSEKPTLNTPCGFPYFP